MTQDVFKEYNDLITTTIKTKPVTYTTSSGPSKNIIVHCYYVDAKNIGIAVYAVKNKHTHAISKYILKININGNRLEFSDSTAQSIYNTLCAKHEAQIAKTQLKKNFNNRAFVRKR